MPYRIITRLRAQNRWWQSRNWIIATTALTAAVVAIIWLAWPRPESAAEPPRARQYADVNACLLTGERGVADPDAALVWASMRQTSLATQVRVQYLAVVGPQTTQNARTFLSSLAQARCTVIFATGESAVAAVDDAAPTFPDTTFITIGGGRSLANVRPIPGDSPAQIQSAVSEAIEAVAPKS